MYKVADETFGKIGLNSTDLAEVHVCVCVNPGVLSFVLGRGQADWGLQSLQNLVSEMVIFLNSV